MQRTSPLSSFFKSLVTPGAPVRSIPVELGRVARSLLGRSDNEAEADDLVGDFLLRLVDATHRRTAGSAAHLVDLDEAQLRALVRHRMRHLVAERSPTERYAHLQADRITERERGLVDVDLAAPPPAEETAPSNAPRRAYALLN